MTTTQELTSVGTTLQDAINQVDSNSDTTSVNSIVFQIPTTDPGYNPVNRTFTISLAPDGDPLPPITNPTFVDGTTEKPAIVVIDGQGVPAPADGLDLEGNADGSTIQGLEIINFAATATGSGGNGITIETSNNTIGGLASGQGNILGSDGADGILIPELTAASDPENNNLIIGNFIGTDATGEVALGNSGTGVDIFSSNNTIGGPSGAARNLISGNGLDGIDLTNAAATGNVVQGNLIGTDATGGSKLGNARHGVAITMVTGSGSASASNNTVGGPVAGAGNLISGNGSFGVVIFGPNGGATGNVVQGNRIGTDASADFNLGNAGDGIVLSSAADNTVGGTAISARNVVSGNGRYGVVIESNTSTDNLIEGNWIGTDKTGVTAIGNALDGVIIDLGASNNTVGGAAAGAGNLISANIENGIEITGTSTAGNLVQGNLIGSDITATHPLGNAIGVLISDATNNTIGGSSAGAANVFGFNTTAGVQITAAAPTGTVILGNFFGTDASSVNFGNAVGVLDDSGGNTIGGTSAGMANVFGFNSTAGLQINAPNDLVIGNLFGTDASDDNLGNGTGVTDDAAGNTIGGTSAAEANVIGFNNNAGIVISGSGATANVVLGNFIGTNSSGANLGNRFGVEVRQPNNTIGGTAAGSANVIAFSTEAGASISANNIVLEGNFFGTDAAGASLGNADGVDLQSANNTIGGTTFRRANVFGFNSLGLDIAGGAGSADNIVVGNFFGTNAAGDNLANAVGLEAENGPNTIGGTSTGAANVFGFNSQEGLLIDEDGFPGVVVLGNFFGTNASGANLANALGVVDETGGDTIGGTSAGAGNVFGFNSTAGLQINAQNDLIIGNFFGTNALGANIGNVVGVLDFAGSNTIGGTSAGTANIFGFNSKAGVEMSGAGGTGPIVNPGAIDDIVLGNFFGTNANGANLGNVVGVLDLTGSNTIGGSSAGTANVFGFNTKSGLEIDSTADLVVGNFFGTNSGGNSLGNAVGIQVNAGNNTIGGTFAGAGNVFGANTTAAVSISAGDGNLLEGNLVGTAGHAPTNANGIVISSSDNTVGGTSSGAANVIGANASVGLAIGGANNIVIGNFIGTDAAGDNLSNSVGLSLAAGNNTIGGTSTGTANVFGFNSNGLLIKSATAATDETIIGNFFGTNAAGGNLGNDIGLEAGNGPNTIGGTSVGAANIFGFNTKAGLQIFGDGPRGIVVIGNFFGTDPSGDNRGNAVGVLDQSGGNTIGGTSPGTANVFGFNNTAGLEIAGPNDLVGGNLFGTDASGANVGNVVGLLLQATLNTIGGTAANTTIGGTASGAANIFGFNSSAGLQITGSGATNELVVGNLFGTNRGGANLGNAVGVLLQSANNTIGGASAGSGNVFGSGGVAGLQISGAAATNNLVLGNDFGTDASDASFSNITELLLDSASNTIGGTSPGSGNVFGFSTTAGLQIRGPAATKNVVLGNFFGTNASGAKLGNVVGLSVGGPSNTIGGTAAGAGNVFEFNSSMGAMIAGPDATGNVLIGNLIGTNSAGANPSNNIGLDIESAGNTIGGTTPGSANVINQNTGAGIQITGAEASGNVLLGNMIGTDSTGQVALGNDTGVLISGGTGNVIGGTAPGAANVISGNLTAGIFITGSSVTGTQILGNRIGTDPSGMHAVIRENQPDLVSALQNAGVAIVGSVGNTVGGTGPAANLISGNYVGVNLANISAGAGGNLVVGNLIGTDATGAAPLGYSVVGVYINNASGNQIGAPGSPNTISGNSSVGVEIYGSVSTANPVSGSTANLVEANIIGLANNGRTALTKAGQFVQSTGVFILNSSGNTIGGTAPGTGNAISGNQTAGVYIVSQGGTSSGNSVQGNRIGLAAVSGPGPGNNGYGVLLLSSPINLVPLRGAAANRFGRNRTANVRRVSGSQAMPKVKTAKDRAEGAAATEASHHRAIHPAGPLYHRMRRLSR